MVGERSARRAAGARAALVWLGAAHVLLGSALRAQRGDIAGEVQPPLPDDVAVPPAPVLAPEEALASFSVAPGWEISLVAAEPLVGDPVVAAFDERGQLWVCEMRGYMPDADGRGEDVRNGVVAVLSDEDGDGRMDRRTVFLDALVLPRAILPLAGGCLVLSPPELALWRDTDGDGRADAKEVVDTGLGGIESPEHAINALTYQPDNWIRVCNADKRYRQKGGEWRIGATAGGGQWGLTQDALGRALFNTNPDPVRGDLYPSHYAVLNPNHGRGAGANTRLAHSFEVWPARMNTGVNRGYQRGILRDDYTLRQFTSACGPCVLGDEVFVCGPASNLVKRYRLVSPDGLHVSAEATDERPEFLASRDERFRPVNAFQGPDGALYVVDLYRGLIQHRLFLTSWLRAQIEARGLAEPRGLGRIWRVAPEAAPRAPAPRLDEASWDELVAALSHPEPWWRLTAQRLLVEEAGESRAVWERLRLAALEAEAPLGRMHAVWALEGIDGLDPAFVARLLDDPDARVVHAALRVSERFLASGDPRLAAHAAAAAERGDLGLFVQGLHSLGAAATRAGDRELLRLAKNSCAEPLVREALLSGLFQREARFLAALLASEDWRVEEEGRGELLAGLARCVVRQGVAHEIDALFEQALAAPEWSRRAVFEGVLGARTTDAQGEPGPLRLGAAPAAFARLEALPADEAGALVSALVWPGKPGWSEPEVRALDDAERERFARGRAIYSQVCAACHQPSGLGEPGKAPPLRGSPRALGDPQRFSRILLAGLVGPLSAGGESWNGEMPAWSGNDEDLAAVMTYVRREWGHGAEPVTPATVNAARAASHGRHGPWTLAELESLAEPDAK